MRRAMRHRVPRRLSKTDLVAQIGASEDNLEGFASVSSAPGYAPYIYSISELMILLCAGLCAIYIYIYIYIWPKRVADDTVPIFLLKGLCTEPCIYT